jgi:hypothetical protein
MTEPPQRLWQCAVAIIDLERVELVIVDDDDPQASYRVYLTHRTNFLDLAAEDGYLLVAAWKEYRKYVLVNRL